MDSPTHPQFCTYVEIDDAVRQEGMKRFITHLMRAGQVPKRTQKWLERTEVVTGFVFVCVCVCVCMCVCVCVCMFVFGSEGGMRIPTHGLGLAWVELSASTKGGSTWAFLLACSDVRQAG